jgi:3-phosphoshikimate 1-carboxyvinyltransferase
MIEIEGLDGQINATEDVINAGNSGLVLRFCSAVGSLASHPVVITGDHSIRHQRPMRPLLQGLTQLQVSVQSMRGDDYAPLIICGPLQAGSASIEGGDSQPVSALLIAAAFAPGPIELTVCNPGEKPWIALTLEWFDRLGIHYENRNFSYYHLPGRTHYRGFDYTVPGDLSSAAFPIAAALVTQSELTLTNIDMSDSQGDKQLIEVFKEMGASIEIDAQHKRLHVRKGAPLHGITVDINDFIDSVTILAVVACFAMGETVIHGASIARQKECNRLTAITAELQKMGGNIVEIDDGLRICHSSLKGAEVDSHRDHRMVMSLAVAAFGAIGETVISEVECVAKTYPTFRRDFAALGAHIEEDL